MNNFKEMKLFKTLLAVSALCTCAEAQEVNPFSIGSFDGISAFSIRENDPTKASRPFDRDRDGLVPGGGAATVIIESYESAVRRGAPIIAEVLSYGFSSNGDHISVPNVDGPARSLEMALRLAGIDKNQIGYINAHATSTPKGDANEAKAIYQVFGDNMPEVTSTKSQTGHEMWMAGARLAVPLIICIASAVMLWKHRENIVRIRNHTEIGLRSTAKGENRVK